MYIIMFLIVNATTFGNCGLHSRPERSTRIVSDAADSCGREETNRICGISGSLAEREQTALSWGDGVIGERGNSADEGKGPVALAAGPPPCARP